VHQCWSVKSPEQKKLDVTSSLDTKLIPLCAGAKARANRWQYHIQPKSI